MGAIYTSSRGSPGKANQLPSTTKLESWDSKLKVPILESYDSKLTVPALSPGIVK